MKPVSFHGENTLVKAPAGRPNFVDVPVMSVDGNWVSVWLLTPQELADLIVTRKIILAVCGKTHPPVCLAVAKGGAAVS